MSGTYTTLRLKTSVGRWDPRTGTGTVEAVKGQYTDAEGKCHVEALLFEEFGAMSAGVEELLMRVAEVAGQKLTWWQYDQTSWWVDRFRMVRDPSIVGLALPHRLVCSFGGGFITM